MKIFLAGPPHSGKSCLRMGLKGAITRMPGAPYPFLIQACPDGEGSWFHETAALDPVKARALKDSYKKCFTEEFVKHTIESIREISLPLVFIDLGGKITPENRRIVAAGGPNSVAVLVVAKEKASEAASWREFLQGAGCRVIAEIVSDYNGPHDTVVTRAPLFQGIVHHLERGEDLAARPTIQGLADFLLGGDDERRTDS